jgi:predicted O-linked N-acetylglucosamine transferase (SPINDLY family)
MTETWLRIQQEANFLFQEQKYTKAAELYEKAISQKPNAISNYWFLGLALLLQGDETEAQIAWMTPILEASEEQQERWLQELLQTLHAEAKRQEAKGSLLAAWPIRKHIQELNPNYLDNLLYLLKLSIATNQSHDWESDLKQVTQLLSDGDGEVDTELLLNVLQNLLDANSAHHLVIHFVEVCVEKLPDSEELVNLLMDGAQKWRKNNYIRQAAQLLEICVQLSPNNLAVLKNATSYLQSAIRYIDSISIAEQFLAKAEKAGDRLAAFHLLIRGYLSAGGNWQKALAFHEQHQNLLQEIVNNPEENDIAELTPMLTAGIYSAYFEDFPSKYRPLRNQYANLCQEKLQVAHQEQTQKYQNEYSLKRGKLQPSKKLKIGYISECFRRHSVGWLVRWTLLHHNRERFEIHAYSGKQNAADPLHNTFAQICYPNFYNLDSPSFSNLAQKITEDDIDILVDLDSLTSNLTCAVTALKPVPIQVTWLGFDASGFPAVDYFLADPYVLPESASEYYTETIWRLPQTYIAVDGFEIAVPTVRRDTLDIPNDAIVYLSTQAGAKRNPHNVRTQMKILKEVPNSYFLVKALYTDRDEIRKFLEEIAESEGISCDRLRFLPDVPLESTHRANLGVADVVLDTYPYNGATTTLETLWMERPLVTQVGSQFAARNSYTMLMNAGVTEGIAWNEEEYIEWGIRLGKDATLRQKIAWQLRVAKQTSPLWNTKQFVTDLEQAYEQMWQKFVDGA